MTTEGSPGRVPDDPGGLLDVLDDAWRRVRRGAERRDDPMGLPVLAGNGADGPRARIVVLRDVDAARRTLICHTDARSAKCAQLRRDPRCTWLFYDPDDGIQLRWTGRATLHLDDALADARWAASRPFSRRCYLAPSAPGTPLDRPASPLPPDLRDRAPTEEESAAGRAHFAVVRTAVDALDWLRLDGRGHLRARFELGEEKPRGRWVVP